MRRLRYGALAAGTIAVGLVVHGGWLPLGKEARDVTGDALWAMMIVWWISALVPSLALRARAVLSLAICFAVELGQLYHATYIDAIRSTTLGHLVLGSGFDPRDLGAYTAGVLIAALLDRRVSN